MARLQPVPGSREARRERGDFPTPPTLVDLVVDHTLPALTAGATVRVLDPTCGDGRFLIAAAQRVQAAGAHPILYGVDAHGPAVNAARTALAAAGFGGVAEIVYDDARRHAWPDESFDVIVGNPPFRSPLSADHRSTGGIGPYTDLASEVLALSASLVRADGGRIGFVLPQSVLAARDAAPVRAAVDAVADLVWSWWSPERHFDAEVIVCALAFERRSVGAPAPTSTRPWTDVVTNALGVPDLVPIAAAGTLGDRVRITANFRDQYYGMVGAVHDDTDGSGVGPPLVTSGLIDPGRCWWGERDVRFAGARLRRPRVDVEALAPWMQRWAADLAVPKVLVANQSRVIEAVADRTGAWLPAVPVLTLRPLDGRVLVDEVAAVLTSPVATCWAWHRAAGTGRSATSVRLGPRWLGALPWPAGSLTAAVEALRAGDVVGCGRAVLVAFGREPDDALVAWWQGLLPVLRPSPPD